MKETVLLILLVLFLETLAIGQCGVSDYGGPALIA